MARPGPWWPRLGLQLTAWARAPVPSWAQRGRFPSGGRMFAQVWEGGALPGPGSSPGASPEHSPGLGTAYRPSLGQSPTCFLPWWPDPKTLLALGSLSLKGPCLSPALVPSTRPRQASCWGLSPPTQTCWDLLPGSEGAQAGRRGHRQQAEARTGTFRSLGAGSAWHTGRSRKHKHADLACVRSPPCLPSLTGWGPRNRGAHANLRRHRAASCPTWANWDGHPFWSKAFPFWGGNRLGIDMARAWHSHCVPCPVAPGSCAAPRLSPTPGMLDPHSEQGSRSTQLRHPAAGGGPTPGQPRKIRAALTRASATPLQA